MGDTRRYAERVDLIAMHADVTARLDRLRAGQPRRRVPRARTRRAEPFTVALPPGTYEVDWFDVTSRTAAGGDLLTVRDSGPTELTSPFRTEPGVAHLRRTEPDQ